MPAFIPAAVTDRIETGRLAPPILTLTDEMRDLAALLTYGLEQADEIEGKLIEAGWPLTLRQAARHLGMRLARSRDIAEAPCFTNELAKQLAARRNSEKARNLATAVTIRDDEGLNLAADKTVRLKAIGVIDGTEGKGLSIQINNNNGGQQVVNPGYVIRLMPEPAKAEADQKPMITIEGTATSPIPQHEGE